MIGLAATAMASPVVRSAPIVLADLVNEPGQGGNGQGFGKALPIGLIVLIIFFIAVGFLVRSMTKHLKKMPRSFDPEERARLDAEAAEAEAHGEPRQPQGNSLRDRAWARAEAREEQAETPTSGEGS